MDGVVPYLTPSLLHSCFPPESAGSKILVGIAVRDTCVQPVHKDGDDPLTSNPRGYTFSAPSFTVDSWIEPYKRFTVPSFDLIQDSKENEKHRSMPILSTDNKAMLWTPHGRQSITPEMYYEACKILKSNYAVSLYDMAPIFQSEDQLAASMRRKQQKQLAAAGRRTQSWWENFQSSSKDDRGESQLWLPITLHDSLSPNDVTTEIRTRVGKIEKVPIAGIALIGWNYLSDECRKSLLEAADSTNFSLAVLSTHSFREILDLLSKDGVTVIGSNLPQLWALQKRAFLVDISCSTMATGNKRRRRSGENSQDGGCDVSLLDHDGCIELDYSRENLDVSTHPWFRDESPIIDGCRCLACQNHRQVNPHCTMSALCSEALLISYSCPSQSGLCLSSGLCEGVAGGNAIIYT